MHNILIVDDSKTVLTVVESELTKQIDNITIYKALTKSEAEVLLKTISFHIAIVDVNLPDAPNGEAIDSVSAYNIPVVVLTGGVDNSLREIIFQKEIVEFISKNDINNITYAASVCKRILKNYETNVLVVEDSSTARMLLARQLKKLHINVLEAVNPIEAIKILEKNDVKISMVITDYEMPEMNGLDFTFYLRKTYRKDVLSIIALSAQNNSALSVKFLKYGANDFLYKPFTPEEFSVRISSNLELLDIFSENKEHSYRDFLTGMYNRRFFFESAETIIKKAHRNHSPLLVAMLDIDHFKLINDTYGHDIGDIAIKEVASILKQTVRSSDLISRFGGEEFCLLLENISIENARELLENIRAKFESNIIRCQKNTISYTVSIGAFYGDSSDIETIIKDADLNLYEAKENGRNRVVLKSPQFEAS